MYSLFMILMEISMCT
uniref:Uncharacterized protein n=1 Tax=Anguilla anguilla TaxID=7936 RepID=A0A0E9TNT4_ANGAN